MVRDVRYIIKRIIIGVGIAICMYFFRNFLFLNAYALEVSNYGIGNTETVISNTTTYYEKQISGNPWSTFAGMSGYVTGSFALQKVNGTSTSINVFPTQIFITTNTGYQDYVCDIGTAMEGNSTFNGGAFTYRCPIKMGTNGVTRIVFQFQNIQTNYPSDYRLSIGSGMSFEVIEDANVNVDTSGTTSAIWSQVDNDNRNTDRIITSQNATKNSVDSVNNSINSDDTTGANTQGSSFFNDFQSDSHGLSGIVTAPLRLINSLTESTCSPLVLPLPFVNQNLTLPCMSTVYSRFPQFLTLYQLITTGLIGYYVIVNIFKKVRDFQNPNNDKVEVLEL